MAVHSASGRASDTTSIQASSVWGYAVTAMTPLLHVTLCCSDKIAWATHDLLLPLADATALLARHLSAKLSHTVQHAYSVCRGFFDDEVDASNAKLSWH
eukprot:1904-Heterococcus_DN1.PRE.7